MALTQMLYSLDNKQILQSGTLISEQELEDTLCENIQLLDSNWLVIGQQIITANGKRLDLLCIDRGGSLIVLELKKDLTPREVTAQVIEYASYVSEMGFEELAQAYLKFAEKHPGVPDSLDKAFLQKFGTELDESSIDKKPKMVIVAANMDDGTEHIIRYLRQAYNVDINILFFQVFLHGNDRIMSRVWFEENMELEAKPEYNANWNQEYYISFGEDQGRKWEDARKYGFISAGGGKWYTQTLKMLRAGDRIWVNIPHTGYVGVGIVQAEVQQASDAAWEIDGNLTEMKALALNGSYFYSEEDAEHAEFVVPVKWIKTLPEKSAVREVGFFGNQNTVCRPTTEKWNYTVKRLKELWSIKDSQGVK